MPPDRLLQIAGMHAVHAVRAVETALGGLPGVTAVESQRGEARVSHDGGLEDADLCAAVEAAGFTVTRVVAAPRRLPTLEP